MYMYYAKLLSTMIKSVITTIPLDPTNTVLDFTLIIIRVPCSMYTIMGGLEVGVDKMYQYCS